MNSVFDGFSAIVLHFSNSFGTKIVNENGKRIGLLSDFFVDYEEVYPLVLALQYQSNKQCFYISWSDVIKFSYEKIVIRNNAFLGRSRTFPKAATKKDVTSLMGNQNSAETIEYPPLGKIVLDRQIVDTFGKKVVRVNDIQMIRAGQNLRVTHACIGIRSMVRRLGYENIIDGIVKTFNSNSKYLSKETLINWKFVHAIPNRNIHSSVQLNLSNDDIKNIHPADLADILEDLDTHGRDLIFQNLDPKTAAETLSEVEEDLRHQLIKNEAPAEVARIIEEMDADDAADILSDFSDKRKDEIIEHIQDDEHQEEIQELLEYEEDTAGGLMTTEVFEIPPETRKSAVLSLISEKYEELETIYDIYVVDSNQKLLGTCPLHELLIQKEDLTIGEIMNKDDIKTLSPDTHWREVASYMSKYNLITLPITDENQNILGIVSVDDVMECLLDE